MQEVLKVPEKSHLEKYIQKCSQNEVTTIIEFLQAARLNSIKSQEATAVIDSLLKDLRLTSDKQMHPSTNDYFADTSDLTDRQDSMGSMIKPDVINVDSPDEEEEYVVRKIKSSQVITTKTSNAIQKKKPFNYDTKSTNKQKLVDLTDSFKN